MRQSFAWWSFSVGLEPAGGPLLLERAAAIGFEGVEMLPEELWPAARAAGLELVTLTGHEIEVGFNDPANHRAVGDEVRRSIEQAAAAGIPFVIVFAGNRGAYGDEDAKAHCADGLAPLAEAAAGAGVTLLLELLNSKVDHPGYQCDHSAFGFDVVRRVSAPGLRVLFDCYHMQLMEGDLSRTLTANLELVGHVHTGGVPGRRDLDDRQEVNWRGIAGLLRHLGYEGWVGHELIPRGSAEDALAQAYELFAPPPGAHPRA